MTCSARPARLPILIASALMFAVACSPAPASQPAAAPKATEAPAAKSAAPEPAPKPAAPAKAQKPAAAASSDWNAIVAAAKKEKLVIVTQPSSLEKQAIAEFQKAYPDIEVEHVAARPSDISPRVITEQQNGVFNFDVMHGPGNNMNNVLLPANAYQEIPDFIVRPELKDPSKWRGPFEMYSSPKGKFIFNDSIDNSNTAAVFVNREFIPVSELKDVDAILDPKFKGKIVADDCTVPAHGLLTLIGLYNTKGEDFVRTLLLEQKPVFQDTIRVTTEWIATGRYPIAIGMDVPTLTEFQKNGIGANIDRFNAPLPSARGIAVFRNAPHPNAAKVYIDWALSQTGQQAWGDASRQWNPPGFNSRRTDVTVHDPSMLIDLNTFDITTVATWGADSGAPVTRKLTDLCKEARAR